MSRAVLAALVFALVVPSAWAAVPPQRLSSHLQDDCGTGADASDEWSVGTPILVGACAGSLALDDVRDAYAFDVAAWKRVSIRVVSDDLSFDANWCAGTPHGEVMMCGSGNGQAVMRASQIYAGTWLLRIDGFDGQNGGYTLEILVDDGFVQDDCGLGRDAYGGWMWLRIPHTAPFTCTGALHPSDGDLDDYMSFGQPDDSTVTLVATPLDGATLRFCLTSCATSSSPVTFTWESLHGGDAWIRVSHGADGARYELRATATPLPPENDCGLGADGADDPAAAPLLVAPFACRGIGRDVGDVDLYAFDAQAGDFLELAPGGTGYAHACAHAPSGAQVGCGRARAVLQETGRHVVGVRTQYVGEWSFQVNLIPGDDGGAPECGAPGDAADVRGDATAQPLPLACAGALDQPGTDHHDWLAFDATAGEPLSLRVAAAGSLAAEACLYAPGASAPMTCRSTSSGFPALFDADALETGTYHLHLRAMQGAGSYDVEARAESLQDDCGTARDGGDSFAGAVALALPVLRCEGSLPALLWDSEDWYRVDAAGASVLAVEMDNPPLFDYDLCVWRPSGTLARCLNQRVFAPEALAVAVDEPGEWRIQVRAVSGAGVYALTARAV